jgi:hypothetical protein
MTRFRGKGSRTICGDAECRGGARNLVPVRAWTRDADGNHGRHRVAAKAGILVKDAERSKPPTGDRVRQDGHVARGQAHAAGGR